jgi:hypothetical protein
MKRKVALLQSLAERLGRLPGLLVADGGPNILVAEQFLDLPKIFSHVVEEDGGRAVAQPVGGDLPTPIARQAARSRRLNARLENGSPEYPAKTNCDPAKAIPPGARILLPLKLS